MIYEIISSTYSSNSYILTGDCTILIDPGLPENIPLKSFLQKKMLTINCMINTHCHYDHIGGNFGEEIYVHENDANAIETGNYKTAYMNFVSEFNGFPVKRRLKENDIISTGNHSLKVLHTPGHTSGSICLLDTDTNTLFSGDTWFMNGIGRTDLPSGNLNDLEKSLMKLAGIDAKHICPGHGVTFENNIENIIRNFFPEDW